jgi:hypothetical protein
VARSQSRILKFREESQVVSESEDLPQLPKSLPNRLQNIPDIRRNALAIIDGL